MVFVFAVASLVEVDRIFNCMRQAIAVGYDGGGDDEAPSSRLRGSLKFDP